MSAAGHAGGRDGGQQQARPPTHHRQQDDDRHHHGQELAGAQDGVAYPTRQVVDQLHHVDRERAGVGRWRTARVSVKAEHEPGQQGAGHVGGVTPSEHGPESRSSSAPASGSRIASAASTASSVRFCRAPSPEVTPVRGPPQGPGRADSWSVDDLPVIDVAPLRAGGAAPRSGGWCGRRHRPGVPGHRVLPGDPGRGRPLPAARPSTEQPHLLRPPQDEKGEAAMAVAAGPGGAGSRGGELTAGRPDHKEGCYFVGRARADHPACGQACPCTAPTCSPPTPPSSAALVLRWIDEMTTLGHHLARWRGPGARARRRVVPPPPHRRPHGAGEPSDMANWEWNRNPIGAGPFLLSAPGLPVKASP